MFMEAMKKDWRAKVLIVLFVLLSVWWKLSPEVIINSADGPEPDFGSVYFTVALWGALCGLASLKHEHSSPINRARMFFSFGLLCQVFGQMGGYIYYVAVQNIQIPYPSVGDIGYFLSIPCYLLGAIHLAKAAGVKWWVQSFENKFEAIVISVVTLAVAYGLFLGGYVFDWSDPLRVFLDFAYPLGQALYVFVAILAYLAVQADPKNPTKQIVFLALLALVIQFLCDYMFVYEASRGTWMVGGVNDYLYLVSYFVMGMVVLRSG